ncbi:MAG: DUF3617 family protein [Acidobacteriota bacterium]
MALIGIRAAASCVLSCFALGAFAAGGPPPVPPVKPGLWEVRSSMLDADGHEMERPEMAAMSRMTPEVRARMAEVMKARGLSMPDASGVTKACLTKEMFESGAWQQMAADAGCTTTYSTSSSTAWKWHTSCATLKSESDGESAFTPESYRTQVKTTSAMTGKTNTSTRTIQGKWIGANCGDVKPFTPPAAVK